MREDSVKTIVYTQAPEAADYSYSTTVENFEITEYGQTLKWRKVEVNTSLYRTRYQCGRYGSFLRGATTLDDPRLVPFGEGRWARDLI